MPLECGRAERRRILLGGVLVQCSGIGIANALQPLRDRLEHELVVAVRLLGLVALRGVVGGLGLLGLAEQIGLVLGEQVELATDEIAEPAAAKAQRSSS
jgi:hypothetical protein